MALLACHCPQKWLLNEDIYCFASVKQSNPSVKQSQRVYHLLLLLLLLLLKSKFSLFEWGKLLKHLKSTAVAENLSGYNFVYIYSVMKTQ